MGYRRENETAAARAEVVASSDPRLTREPASDSVSYMAGLADEADLARGERGLVDAEAAYLAWWEETSRP